MARDIDVYQLVRGFAGRNRLTEIEYRAFAQAVQRQARLSDQSQPVFRDLSLNPDLVLAPRLFLLAKQRKLALQTAGNEISSIVLPEHYAEVFFQAYRRIDDNPDLPFPDEEGLKTSVPPEWIQSLSLDSDLGTASDAQGQRPVALYRIVFPEGVRPLVVPSAFVPDKLLEYAVLKLRQYLRQGANRDYMHNKLAYAFPGKESQLKETLGAILTKPYDSIAELKRSSSDFIFPFWAYFLSAVKKDLEKKKDKTAEDVAIHQAALVCEFYSNHYKGKAQRLQDLELALKTLDAGLRKPPYNFSLEDIMAFRDGKGVTLLGKFDREEFEVHLKGKCTKAEPGFLPEILIVAAAGRRLYIAKDRALLLAVKLLGEARADLRSRIVEKWRSVLEDFRTLPPIDDDEAFRNELSSEIESRFPLLAALLGARLLPFVYDELRAKGEAQEGLDRLFYKGDLVPLEELLELTRKGLLADARMLLPFWHTVPIISGLARLFRSFSRRKEERTISQAAAFKAAAAGSKVLGKDRAAEAAATAARSASSAGAARRAEFAAAAINVAKQLVPSGYSLDEYLGDLEGRWNTLLNPDAKRNLTEDINVLVRDFLRGVLRTMGGSSLTMERVRNLAATLADTPNLLKIKNHQMLELYIQLYMAKVLGAGGTRL